MKTIHPAIAEHVMEENARLRVLLMSVLKTPRGSSGRIILEPDEEAAIRAALSQQAEPAPAQEPVGYQFQDREGVWKQFMNERHYEDTLADGTWPIRAIYAAPIAQTAPQPEQSDSALLDALFIGQVAAEKAGMVNGTTQWGLCLLRHIRSALSAQGESHEQGIG